MYYINDYRQKSIDKIIPYLIEFPQVVKIIENSSDRYQAIEDLLWKIADNFKVDDARGIFLDIHAHNEDANIIYADKAEDAFTYGSLWQPSQIGDINPQVYGTGHYYSQASYLTGVSKNISEDKMIRGILAKIIENNTNGTIEDLIQALKLYFNAEKVSVLESYPLSISISLEGKNLEISTTGNKEIIKKFLPACVSLKNLYLNDKQFNIYQLGKSTSYGESRFPLNITENYVSYPFYSECINLNSQNNEYIKTNYNEFSENMYCCFTGELNESYAGNILISSKNNTDSFYLNINSQLHFELMYNNTSYNTDVLAEAGNKYTFILSNSDNKLKLWVLSGVKITGEDRNKDEAYITNQILNTTPSIIIDNYTTINNAPIYINGLQNDASVVCGDFTYYGIVFGHIIEDINDINEYYITSYGQKQILFNCISNNNHLNIYSDEVSGTDTHIELTQLQSDFKYANNHGNSKYSYFDGKSNIKYDTTNIYTNYNNEYIDNFDLNLSLCTPISLNESKILSGFIYNENIESDIFITDTNGLVVTVPILNTTNDTYQQLILTTTDNILFNNMFNDIKISYSDNTITIYNNNESVYTYILSNNYKIVYRPPILNIGNKEFLGLIKNIDLSFDINGNNVNINIPSMYTLRDDINNIPYINEGVRLITAPQLMNDETNLDLYGNTLIGVR